MYRVLTIGGKDYKLEYSMEAALYADCLEEIMSFMTEIGQMSIDAEHDAMEGLKEALKAISDMPQKVITLFYAGLLEYHGLEGDCSVPDKGAAKRLLKQYFDEHKDDGQGDFYSVMALIIDQMGQDGFFELTGANKMFQITPQTETQQPSRKKKKVSDEQ